MIVPKNDGNSKETTNMRKLLSKLDKLKPVDSFYRTTSKLQIGGAFRPSRVYGGQTVVQAYIAAKCHRPDCTPILIDFTFYGAGSVLKPIDYYAETNDPNSMHMRILAKQDTKLLNCANVRLAKNEKLDEARLKLSNPTISKNITLNCPSKEEMLKKMNISDWLQQYGFSYRLLSGKNRQIFDAWIPDPFHFVGQSCETKPFMIWLRLRKDFKNIKFTDKMILPLLISDYVVGIPSTIAFDQRQILIKSMASMTHKVMFHSDEFDPLDHFLVISTVEKINGLSLAEGRVYTRSGLPVLSYIQQGYFEFAENELSKM